MSVHPDISTIFPEYLFWDSDMRKLDLELDQEFIIPRALYMTNARTFDANISQLEEYYSVSQIITALKSTKENISNEVCRMVAQRYHIPTFQRFSH